MFRALTKQGEYINAATACQNSSYFCPVCGQPLQLKASASKCMRPHFAHLSKYPCTDTWKYDMSEWHLSWQEKFPEECREVVMEKDGEKHRADIFIRNTVIEFQHSPIRIEEFQARNKFYLRQNNGWIKLIWIFDMTGKIKSVDRFSIRLPRKNNLFDDYKKKRNFEIYFQDGDELFLLTSSNFGREFSYYNCGMNISQDMFLADFIENIDVPISLQDQIKKLEDEKRKYESARISRIQIPPLYGRR